MPSAPTRGHGRLQVHGTAVIPGRNDEIVNAMLTTDSVRRIRLCVISYAPLALMLAVRAFPVKPADLDSSKASEFWSWSILALVGLLDGWSLPRRAGHLSAMRVRFTEVTDQGAAVAGYLATYILPLVAFNFAGWRDMVIATVYGGVLLIIYVRSDLALVNPTLYAFGWQLLSGTIIRPEGDKRVLILRRFSRSISDTLEAEAQSMGDFFVVRNEATP